MRLKPHLLAIILGAAVAVLPLRASAQPQQAISEAKKAGILGERFDGYMGFAATPSQALRKQVGAVNIRRRALYINLARRRGVTPEVAGIAAGCELLARLAVGEVYMLSDRVWRRRGAGEAAPSPPHCSAN